MSLCDIPVSEKIHADVKNNVRCGGAWELKVKCINDFLITEDSAALWIDADSLVTGDLGIINSKITDQDYDVVCTRRKHRTLEHEIFALGVLGFSNSLVSREFTESFYNKMMTSGGVEGWFHDQLEFFRTFEEKKPRHYSLRNFEHSLKGVKESIVYSRREAIEITPNKLAEILGFPIKSIDSLPDNIYPI